MPWPSLVFTVLATMLAAAPVGKPAPLPPGRRVVDRVVAIVGQQPLLLSELELETRIALIQKGGTAAAGAPLTDTDLAAALEWAIGQRLAFAEAERLQVFEVDDADVAKAVEAFEARFPTPAALRAFLESQEATPGEVAAVLRRDLRVARFLESKVKLSARVTEDELRRYWSDHATELEGLPYERVRDAIKAQLTRERYQTLTRKELETLRAKADVRIVAAFGSPPPPAADAARARP